MTRPDDELQVEARRLREGLASGRLTRARVGVAAALGAPAARCVVGDVTEGPRPPRAWSLGPLRLGRSRAVRGLEAWALALCRAGRDVTEQVAGAALTLLPPRWSALEPHLDLALSDEATDDERAAEKAAALCADLVLAGHASAAAVEDRVREHLLAWGLGRRERPAWSGALEPEAEGPGSSPLVRLARCLLEDARARGAARVVVRREQGAARVLFEEGGALRERMAIPLRTLPALVARLACLAGLDALPGAPPQRGAFAGALPGGSAGERVVVATAPAPGVACELALEGHRAGGPDPGRAAGPPG